MDKQISLQQIPAHNTFYITFIRHFIHRQSSETSELCRKAPRGCDWDLFLKHLDWAAACSSNLLLIWLRILDAKDEIYRSF